VTSFLLSLARSDDKAFLAPGGRHESHRIGLDTMIENMQRRTRLESRDNCGVCGSPLIYGTESVAMRCVYCRELHSTQTYCPQGHYICDACHQSEALDVLRHVLKTLPSASPSEILECVMSHPSVPMHGPEHHAIVPAVIVAAVRNAGYPVPEGAVEEAVARGTKVPGGWCGLYGVCGAAIGVGIAVSVLTGATPLTGKRRSLANEATSFVLSGMLDGHPRCCKRAARKAVEAAVVFLRDRMDIILETGRPGRCSHWERNRECPKEECCYYVPSANHAHQSAQSGE